MKKLRTSVKLWIPISTIMQSAQSELFWGRISIRILFWSQSERQTCDVEGNLSNYVAARETHSIWTALEVQMNQSNLIRFIANTTEDFIQLEKKATLLGSKWVKLPNQIILWSPQSHFERERGQVCLFFFLFLTGEEF